MKIHYHTILYKIYAQKCVRTKTHEMLPIMKNQNNNKIKERKIFF